jgi:hypothetical protein
MIYKKNRFFLGVLLDIYTNAPYTLDIGCITAVIHQPVKEGIMRIQRTAAVLFSVLVLPAMALAQPSAECPTPESPRMALQWDLQAPELGISWHGSLELSGVDTTTPAVEAGPAPLLEWEEDGPNLLEAARNAVKLVQAILQFPAGLLALASRHLF